MNTQGRSRSRGKQRKERGDSREGIDRRGAKGQKTAVLSRYLFSRLQLDSCVFTCPGTVPTSLLPYPGLVKTPPPSHPPYEMQALLSRLAAQGKKRSCLCRLMPYISSAGAVPRAPTLSCKDKSRLLRSSVSFCFSFVFALIYLRAPDMKSAKKVQDTWAAGGGLES